VTRPSRRHRPAARLRRGMRSLGRRLLRLRRRPVQRHPRALSGLVHAYLDDHSDGHLDALMTDDHVHDFGAHPVRLAGRLVVGSDCACGRCPRGVCDGTGLAEPGWNQTTGEDDPTVDHVPVTKE